MFLIIVYFGRADLSCQGHSLYPLHVSTYLRFTMLQIIWSWSWSWCAISNVTICFRLNLMVGESGFFALGRTRAWLRTAVSFCTLSLRHYTQTLFVDVGNMWLVTVCRCCMLQRARWQHDSKDFTGATSRSNTASLCDSNQIIRSREHQQGTTARCGPSVRRDRQKYRLTFKSIDNEHNDMASNEWGLRIQS